MPEKEMIHDPNAKTKHFTKGEIIQSRGLISHNVFYVKKGLVRSYLIDSNGKEHIFMYASEGWLIADIESIEFHQPAQLFIDCIEDSEVLVIHRENQHLDFSNEEAVKENINHYSLVHHSDRGVQYCSYDYTDLLKKKKVWISMTKPASPHENAIAERVNGILKEEWLEDIAGETNINPKKYIIKIIKIYNDMRPHESLGNLTPNQVHDEGFTRHDTERVIGKKYNWKKKTEPVKARSENSNAIGPNDYSLASCSSAELASALSWYCKLNETS